MTPVELPLNIVHNRPLIQLMYKHGSRSAMAWTLLDTGGGSTILGRGLAELLQLVPVGEPLMEDGELLTPVEPPDIMSNDTALLYGSGPAFAADQDMVSPTGGGAIAFLPAAFLRQFTASFYYSDGLLIIRMDCSDWSRPEHPGRPKSRCKWLFMRPPASRALSWR